MFACMVRGAVNLSAMAYAKVYELPLFRAGMGYVRVLLQHIVTVSGYRR